MTGIKHSLNKLDALMENGRRSTTSTTMIQRAEAVLGASLPPSYVELLLEVDIQDLPEVASVLWIGKKVPYGYDLLKERKRFAGPDFLLPILVNDEGDTFCLDLRTFDSAGEYPIVRFNHEIDSVASSGFELVAPSFASFFDSLVETALAIEADNERQRRDIGRQKALADASITAQTCPHCGLPCPSYRKTCKACGQLVTRS